MIVVDGDSVALGATNGVQEDQTWAYLLAKSRGVPLANISTVENTVGGSLGKLSHILNLRPRWYIAQFGQWCFFRRGGPDKDCVEPLGQFKRNAQILIQVLLAHKILVCLVTPPPQVPQPKFAKDAMDYVRALRELAQGISLLDAHSYMAEDVLYTTKGEHETWFQEGDIVHYSAKGHARVAGYFNFPESKHIGY